MPNRNLTGPTRLTPTDQTRHNAGGKIVRLYKCDCGEEKWIIQENVVAGNSRSCGCIRREMVVARNMSGTIPHPVKHGGAKTLEYKIFKSAKGRCVNPNDPKYSDYGGRGIKFLFSSFQQFIDHIGWRPSRDLSLDRKNNDGNYEPGNVRWATSSEQAFNRRPKTMAAAA
jgi:hypothetical protein